MAAPKLIQPPDGFLADAQADLVRLQEREARLAALPDQATFLKKAQGSLRYLRMRDLHEQQAQLAEAQWDLLKQLAALPKEQRDRLNWLLKQLAVLPAEQRDRLVDLLEQLGIPLIPTVAASIVILITRAGIASYCRDFEAPKDDDDL